MTGEQAQLASASLLQTLHFGPLSIIAPALFSSFVKLTREIPFPRRIIRWRIHLLVCAHLSLFSWPVEQLFRSPLSGANYHVCRIYHP